MTPYFDREYFDAAYFDVGVTYQSGGWIVIEPIASAWTEQPQSIAEYTEQ